MNVLIDRKEVLRYLGYKGQDISELLPVIESIIKNVEKNSNIKYIVDYREIISANDNELILDNGLKLIGKAIQRHLKDCKQVAIIIATIGYEVDKKLLSMQATDPAKALILDSTGSAMIEEVMNTLTHKIEKEHEHKTITKRFSPGYADFPLETNRELFRLYNVTKRLNIVINDSCLMTPAKSVTAFVGIKR